MFAKTADRHRDQWQTDQTQKGQQPFGVGKVRQCLQPWSILLANRLERCYLLLHPAQPWEKWECWTRTAIPVGFRIPDDCFSGVTTFSLVDESVKSQTHNIYSELVKLGKFA